MKPLLHQIWLSTDPIPEHYRKSHQSFFEHHPDASYRLWSLDDVKKFNCGYMWQAIEQRKWAFASDYIRLRALVEHGGVYADMDTIFNGRMDKYRANELVVGWETRFHVGPHFIAANIGNSFLVDVVRHLESRQFLSSDRSEMDCTPLPNTLTYLLLRKGMLLNGFRQELSGGILVEKADVFSINVLNGRNICDHLYDGAWSTAGTSYRGDVSRDWERSRRYSYRTYHSLLGLALPNGIARHITNLPAWKTAFPSSVELASELGSTTNSKRYSRLFEKSKKLISTYKNRNIFPDISNWHRMPTRKEKNIKRIIKPNINKNSEKKVSVIVPIYNVEPFLEKCIISIISQRYNEFDIILVNDGSTDRSEEICLRYEEEFESVKYYTKENGGLGSARNFGLERADSDYVCFVDSDDYLEAGFIEKLALPLRAGAELSICDFRMVSQFGLHLSDRFVSKHWGPDDGDIKKHALLSEYECYAWNKMYHLKTFKENNDLRYGLGWFEDLHVTPAIIAKSDLIHFVPDILYNYVQRNNSIISQSKHNVEKNFDIFAAAESIKSKRNYFGDELWNEYFEWRLPKHLFIYRIPALHGEVVHSRRVELIREFSKELNEKFPGWNETGCIKYFVNDGKNAAYRFLRKKLVEGYVKGDIYIYSKLKQVYNFGI